MDVQITNEKNQPVPAQVEDNEDGTYSVAYTTSAPGPLKVNVLHVEKRPRMVASMSATKAASQQTRPRTNANLSFKLHILFSFYIVTKCEAFDYHKNDHLLTVLISVIKL